MQSITDPAHSLLTIGAIATRLGVPLHRVEYVIRSRGIPASGRAGRLRVFAPEAITLIRHVLERHGKPAVGPAPLTSVEPMTV